ncbi:hypothetical protein EJB05_26904, partial [Eragrostis curvula]
MSLVLGGMGEVLAEPAATATRGIAPRSGNRRRIKTWIEVTGSPIEIVGGLRSKQRILRMRVAIGREKSRNMKKEVAGLLVNSKVADLSGKECDVQGTSKDRSKWDHRDELNEKGGHPTKEVDSKTSEMEIPPLEALFCRKCKEPGHVIEECRKPWKCERCGKYGHDTAHCRRKNFSEYVAPLCATQVEGQAFFSIPDCPSEQNAKERANTAIITVVSGKVNARQIESEFRGILSGVWRWSARQLSENKFIMRFPTAQMIKEWGHFKPLGMRTAKAQIEIDPWTSSIEAKYELQQAWFRVRGIPYDKRTEETLAYVGSLVGAIVDIDERSLYKQDYVRIKIACKDVTKVPPSTEGAIIPHMYDFFFEREVTMPSKPREIDIKISTSAQGEQPTPKKKKTNNVEEGSTSGAQQQGGHEVPDNQLEHMRQKVAEIPKIKFGSFSAPPKVAVKNVNTGAKLMADAQKTYGKSVIENDHGIQDGEEGVHNLLNWSPSDDEDDLLSDDRQSQTTAQEETNQIGMVRCIQANFFPSKAAADSEDEVMVMNKEDLYTKQADASLKILEVDGESNLTPVEDMEADKNMLGEGPKATQGMISDKQKLPVTRQSERVQEQVLAKFQDKNSISKKRTLEGTNLNDHNSFAILNNTEISMIAADMGIVVPESKFDHVELMKDLEVARHSLKDKSIPVITDLCNNTSSVANCVDVPDENPSIIECIEEEDSEEENFVLVQSRKKKRELNKLKNSAMKSSIRRSLHPGDMQTVLMAGAQSMFQAAIRVMRSQGREQERALPPPPGPEEEAERQDGHP